MSCTHRQSKLAFLLVMVVLITIPVGVSTAEHTTSEGVFEVEITEATDTVAEGEEVVLTATIENTGAEGDSQQIHLKNSDNDILDSVSNPGLALDPGEREEVTLTWQTGSGDAGTHYLRVSSDDESASESVVVEQTDDDTESDTESSTSEPTSGLSIQSFADDSAENTGVAGGQGTYLGHSYFRIDGTTAQIRGYDVETVMFAEPTDGFVLISDLRTLPTDVNQTEDVVALYDIDVSKQVDQTAATIEFRLNAGSLDGADAEDVVVRRWSGSEWNDLPTSATVDGDVRIEAETPKFSVFAVTTGNETAADTNSGSQGAPADESETAERIENETDESAESETTESETTESETTESETTESETTESETTDSQERFAATALLTHTDNSPGRHLSR